VLFGLFFGDLGFQFRHRPNPGSPLFLEVFVSIGSWTPYSGQWAPFI